MDFRFVTRYFYQCPQCSNQQVESCLLSTAMDLGEPGKDILFGQGLVQANDAYLCLIYTAQCCETDNLPPTNAPIVATPSPSTVESWESPPIQWVVSGDNLVSMSSTTTVGV